MSSTRKFKNLRPSRGTCLEFQPGLFAGVQRLIETPLITGAPVPITFVGSQASDDGWPVYNAPANIASLQAGTAPTYQINSPFLGTLDPGVQLNLGGFFQFSDTTYGNFGTNDIAVEIFGRTGTLGVSQAIAAKRTGVGSPEWLLYITSGSLLTLFMTSGVTVSPVTAALASNTYFHALGFFDRSGSGQWYLQGIASGAAVALTGLNTLDNTKALSIGADSAGAVPFGGVIDLLQFWVAPGFLDSHLQPIIAPHRTHLLYGTIPQKYWGPSATTPTSGTTSYAYQTQIGNDGITRLHRITGGVEQRFVSVMDTTGKTLVGLVNEGVVQNICLQSLTYGSWTTKARLSIPTTSIVCSDGIARTTVVLHEDATAANNHFLQQTLAISNATPYVLSLRARPINRTWILVQLNGKVVSFNLSGSGTVGTAVGSVVGHIKSLGNSWYHVWITLTSSSTAGNPTIFLAEGDNDNSFDGLNQDSVALSHVQVEVGNYPSLPVDTVATAVSKTADSYIASVVGNIGTIELATRFCFWAPTFFPTGRLTLRSFYTDADNRIEVFIDTDGTIKAESRKTAGVNGDVFLIGSKCDDRIHEVLLSVRPGQLSLACDGAWATHDVACDIPSNLTFETVGQNYDGSSRSGPVVIGEIRNYSRYQNSWYDRG